MSSTTAFLRKPPASRQEWDSFHFQHYLDHLRILALINAVNGTDDKMPPPIWPFNPSNRYPYNEAHQLLHQQMDLVSGMPTPDFLHTDLSDRASATSFIWLNWVDHDGFRRLIGV